MIGNQVHVAVADEAVRGTGLGKRQRIEWLIPMGCIAFEAFEELVAKMDAIERQIAHMPASQASGDIANANFCELDRAPDPAKNTPPMLQTIRAL